MPLSSKPGTYQHPSTARSAALVDAPLASFWVVALASSKNDLAIDGLIAALDQTDHAGALAAVALKQRTGVDFGHDQQQWRNWRRAH